MPMVHITIQYHTSLRHALFFTERQDSPNWSHPYDDVIRDSQLCQMTRLEGGAVVADSGLQCAAMWLLQSDWLCQLSP